MPRARSRSSASSRFTSSRASRPTRARSRGRGRSLLGHTEVLASATRRAWAPSCRSRSIRCSLVAAASGRRPASRSAVPRGRPARARAAAARVGLRDRQRALDQQHDGSIASPRAGRRPPPPRVDRGPAVIGAVGHRPPPERERDAAEREAEQDDPDDAEDEADHAVQPDVDQVLPALRVRAAARSRPGTARRRAPAGRPRRSGSRTRAPHACARHRRAGRDTRRWRARTGADEQQPERQRQRHAGEPDAERDDRGHEAAQQVERIAADLPQPRRRRLGSIVATAETAISKCLPVPRGRPARWLPRAVGVNHTLALAQVLHRR